MLSFNCIIGGMRDTNSTETSLRMNINLVDKYLLGPVKGLLRIDRRPVD